MLSIIVIVYDMSDQNHTLLVTSSIEIVYNTIEDLNGITGRFIVLSDSGGSDNLISSHKSSGFFLIVGRCLLVGL